MKKSLLSLLIAGLSFTIFLAAKANNEMSGFRFNLSGLTIASDARLSQYPDWWITVASVSEGTTVTGEELALPYFLGHSEKDFSGFESSKTINITNVGLVSPSLEFPYPTPNSCIVIIPKGEHYVIKIFGTLHAPGGRHLPFIENLSCQVQKE